MPPSSNAGGPYIRRGRRDGPDQETEAAASFAPMPPAPQSAVSRDQLLAELGFSGGSAFADLVNEDPELLLASGAEPSAILEHYRALEKRLRSREEVIEKLRADNGCLRKELASLRQNPTTTTPQNADNRALVKTQMNLLKREIVSQRQTLAQLKRKEGWMKKCLSWSNPILNLGTSTLRSLQVDEEVLEIERIYRERKAQKPQQASPVQGSHPRNTKGETTLEGEGGQGSSRKAETQPSSAIGDEQTRENLRKLTEKYKALRQLYDKAKKRDSERPTADPGCRTLGIDQGIVADFRRRTKSDLQELKSLVTSELGKSYALLKERTKRMESTVDDRVQRLLDKLAEETKKRRELHNKVQELRGNIRVFVRPLLEKERGEGRCIEFPEVDSVQVLNQELQTAKKWEFDKVFTDQADQADVFSELHPLITSALDGYNICIFAYGQTGSGKTHTMQGTSDELGMYQRAFKELFKGIDARRGAWSYRLTASVMEIYNEEIRDLLKEKSSGNVAKPKVQLTSSDGVPVSDVPGLTWLPVLSPDDVHSILARGWEARAVGSTNVNEQSSRSHLIVSLKAEIVTPGRDRLTSKINLVDLAGSERLRKSGAVGQRQKEAVAINKSLSALGDVISARVTKNLHVPYRNSVLTSILSESLGGDSKTVMLLQINPASNSYDESSNSLTFGSRVSAVEMKIVDPRKKMMSS
ncbi:Kinesin member [Perkinsus olseni]|uniref:Kinesin-like protein n=1 Tax=Perkinsus olseni TaxID=32597 RepID=A0A7J6MIM5_PEROL|nr:Kinesin member [Perkinsus olseni]